MSSRALRRAQRELEERQQLESAGQQDDVPDSDEDVVPPTQPKPSLFAMLNDTGDDDADESAEEEHDTSQDIGAVSSEPPANKSNKSRKKKKKGKGPAKPQESEPTLTSSRNGSDLDEIDRALLALKTSDPSSARHTDHPHATIDEEKQQLYSALAVDTQHLHAANEMRKLFGRAAVNGGPDDEPGRARQRGRGQQEGIAAVVAGRNAPANRNLASLGLRRNIFIQGKEEWPRATSGGLGMEVVKKRDDGSIEYRFVHNVTYQSVQGEFDTCVASMDPDRMVQLLQFNPYHISTLLQVSEIAKQQRDNATAGDLLERALFSFGRAVQSTFASNLSQGKARLDFRRTENREFWLAVWRYITTLGLRATWRTAFEWAKLLLQMAPEDDPYCIRLLIDQLALRGREPQAVVDLVESDHLQRIWKMPPNLAMSVVLAHDRLKQPQKARTALKAAIKEYPWIAARLCKDLEISPIPKPIWGKEPVGDHQELLCHLYVPKAKDLWNTTEATSLLVEVAYSIEEELGTGESPYWLANINEVDVARHVILSDDRELLSLIDPQLKAKYTSTSDPLPPDDSIVSYSPTTPRNPGGQDLGEALLVELESLRQYFNGIGTGDVATGAGLLQAMESAGTTIEEYRRNTERVHVLRRLLQEVGVQVVFDEAELDLLEHESDSDA
ncbi:transcriptional repressor TCF25-domain-containing protein [Massariosphaeria phaeospora]|uniref:Transcriptional repressor TCF25-domain-containing protein n=1 Tax=Massariosphaeria phaeospora TaxID=100035 RepID=A0A7C8M6T9_9PLEO|nr:transcriptional repressor TCF25-domain-containing protein [Massariosphaeria phaeospora]